MSDFAVSVNVVSVKSIARSLARSHINAMPTSIGMQFPMTIISDYNFATVIIFPREHFFFRESSISIENAKRKEPIDE